MAATTPFRFIDLFAGIGGFRFALEGLGGECVLTVERDRFARETYATWHGEATDSHPFVGDIEELDVAAVPKHEVLAAGFPCQPFSLAGVSKKNSLGRAHGFEDPTQGTLFFNIKEIAAAHRPAVLILENVKNLRSHDRGRTWETIDSTLRSIDYTPHDRIYDARNWVPQHRERVFIVAFNDDLVDREAPFVMPDPPARSTPLTLGAILEQEVDEKYTLTPKLWEYLRAYRAKHEAKGNGFGYSLFGPGDVARTISARYHKDGSEILIRRPEDPDGRPRRLTPLEAQRLMGFDEKSVGRPAGSLPIKVSDTQAYRQFGSAVVPAVVRHVAEAALAHLDTHRLAEITDMPSSRRRARGRAAA
jgi:DNA (cytosine-5)-methyltransferase 1